jgi:hypothetical protein
VARAPRLPGLLYATAVSPPNRPGDSRTVEEPGLPESARNKTPCRWNACPLPAGQKHGLKLEQPAERLGREPRRLRRAISVKMALTNNM